MTAQTELRDTDKLAGDVSQHVYDEIVNSPGFYFRGEKFRVIYLEEARAMGLPDDDESLILRRDSDGKLFEVDIEASAREFTPPKPVTP